MNIPQDKEIILSYSAVETIQTCPAKYYWEYVRGYSLIEDKDSASLKFGLAIHKGLESRGRGELLEKANAQFKELFPADLDPKHTIKAGLLILKEYYDRYEKEEIRVLMNEYKFKVDLGFCSYRGRIDKLVEYQGETMILDHKTTSDIGQSFIERAKPNMQFTGYIHCAGKVFKKDIRNLMVDGLLVPYPYKTKPLETNFIRFLTNRTDKELNQWENDLRGIVCEIKKWEKNKQYPKYDRAGYNCVSRWSECSYRTLCLIPTNPMNIEPPEEIYKLKKEEEN